MDMTPQEYQEYVKRLAPKSPIFKDTAFAFFIGGAICALGQLIQNGFLSLGLAKADAGTATSICLIFLSALLTGLTFTIPSRALPGPARSCRSRALPTPLSPPPSTLRARIDL